MRCEARFYKIKGYDRKRRTKFAKCFFEKKYLKNAKYLEKNYYENEKDNKKIAKKSII